MRLLPALLLLLSVCLAAIVAAQETPLPQERPVAEEPDTEEPEGEEVEAEAEAPETPPLPRERPEEAEAEGTEEEAEEEADAAAEEVKPLEPPEPPEPPRIYQTACPAVIAGLVEAEMLPPLVEGACGERSPLSVTGVMANGRPVPFSSAATLNCEMATALPDWVAVVDNYLWARENTRVARVLTGTSYMCRGRNREADADISEHGFANALDVIGFELEDGRTVTLPEGWLEALSPEGRLLRFAHDAGCARFTTTLGPEANALHADHLHLDMGCHGERCVARLCE